MIKLNASRPLLVNVVKWEIASCGLLLWDTLPNVTCLGGYG